MLTTAVVGILLQLALQTGIAESVCCDDLKNDVDNRTLAYKMLCSKEKDLQHLHYCCDEIEQDVQRRVIAYLKQCPKHGGTLESCAELYNAGVRRDGVYTIDPDGLGSFQVRCDMTTDGGGWTVFQRRLDGSVDFYRGWADYQAGFGDLKGEFWLGLDRIHRLTYAGQSVLRVDLMDFNDEKRYAKYAKFNVTDKTEKYTLNIGAYITGGGAKDSLSWHNKMKFSTKDNDNDKAYSGACALNWKGGWWYGSCAKSNLNGRYLKKGENHHSGMHWRTWKMDSLKEVEMKVRPAQF